MVGSNRALWAAVGAASSSAGGATSKALLSLIT
jgi:hypothetical protein